MSSEKPLVSICIPVYNTVKYVEETVQCFLNQTYKNVEVVVQDDCSTDGTWELLVSKFSGVPNVKLFRNVKNAGIGDNWNSCYANCRGEYVVIANADDILFNDFIEQAMAVFVKHSEVEIVYCGFELYFDDTGRKERPPVQYEIAAGIQSDSFKVNFFQNPFSWVFGVVKRSTLEKSKLADGRLFLHTQVCDGELRLRVAKQGAVTYYLPNVVGYYRRHENNVSSKRYGEKTSHFEMIESYHRYLKQNYRWMYFKRNLWNVELMVRDFVRQPRGFSYQLLFTTLRFLFK